jgi:hypothetical protein
MNIINSHDTSFDITFKVVYEGVYHYKVPTSIKLTDSNELFKKNDIVFVCENGSGYGFGISKENNFEPGYYDRDSCRQLIIE